METAYQIAKQLGYPKSVRQALSKLDETDEKGAEIILRNARRGIYPDSALTKQTTEKPKHIVRTNHSRVFS